jgi:hypothetical protein
MKTTHAIITALIVLSSVCFGLDQSKVDSFSADIKRACEAQDVEGIKKLHYFEGVPEALVDQSIHTWEVWLLDYVPKQKWAFDTVEFYSKEEYLARPNINKEAVAEASEPKKMNGNLYAPNLEVVAFVNVKFKQPSGGSMGRLNPVGIAPDGSLRFIMQKRL